MYIGTPTAEQLLYQNDVNGFVEAGVWPVDRNISALSFFLLALPTTTEKEMLQKRTIADFSAHIYMGTICSLQKAVSAVQGSKHVKVYTHIGQVF